VTVGFLGYGTDLFLRRYVLRGECTASRLRLFSFFPLISVETLTGTVHNIRPRFLVFAFSI
jgi:hypothetical protein